MKKKVIIDINHPAHVHFFKHVYWKLIKNGHDVIVVASKKDIAFKLLKNYNIPYINIGTYGKSYLSKIFKFAILDIKMFFIVLWFRPDYIIGMSTIRGTHAGLFFKKTKVFPFTDTEHAKEQIALYKNLADKIYTPDCFTTDLGKNHIRYEGYQELAYIHPNYFKPNKDVLKEFNLSKKEDYFILRFVAWNATHDRGQHGISEHTKEKLIRLLEKHGRVLITSEGKIPKKYEKYQISVLPEKIHDLMYYSKMYIGEGGTMASEAALMGIPSLYINTLRMGYISELENKYKLLRQTSEQSEIIKIVQEWLNKKDLKNTWRKRKQKMLKDKIDVSAYIYRQLK